MGKDRKGKYHPPKGKPSGTSKEGLGLRPQMEAGEFDQDNKITNKYTEGPDELADNAPLRHPNRNTQKGESTDKLKEEGTYRTWTEEMYSDDVVDISPVGLPGTLSKKRLGDLAAFRSGEAGCISIYLPTHRAGMEVNEQQDFIEYKNALQEVKQQLEQQGIQSQAIEKILEPAFELLRNKAFWYNLSDGLAVFIAEGFCRYIKLAFAPDREVVINHTFYLMPVLPLMDGKHEFFLLYINRQKTQLFKADAMGMHKVPVEGLAAGINDVVYFDESTGRRSMSKNNGENLESPSELSAGRPEKDLVALYAEKTDTVLQKEVFHHQPLPLLVAGDEELVNAFKKVSAYKNILPLHLEFNLEHNDLNSLYRQARTLIMTDIQENIQAKLDSYYNKSATALTASIPADVIPGAYYGQVDTLFVQKGMHIWGHFDKKDNQLDIHPERKEGDDCLLDKAAVQTVLNGGQVYRLDREAMPGETPVAALLRY